MGQAKSVSVSDNEVDAQMLLAFLYRSPIAIMEVAADGTLGLMNPKCVALLGPFAKKGMCNLFHDFGDYFEDVQAMIQGYQASSGEICKDYRIDICPNVKELDEVLYFTFTISKLDANRFFVCFDDVTEQVIAEEENKRVVSRMLHDLGNSISGIATRVARLSCQPAWSEIEQLDRFLNLVVTEREALDSALGEGKGEALENFINAILNLLKDRSATANGDVEFLATSIRHIEQVLNIHRHYVSSGLKRRFELLDVLSLLNEATLIAKVLLSSRGIKLKFYPSNHLPKFKGDRTKLLRMLVNLLKNAAEAIEEVGEGQGKQVNIYSEHVGDYVEIRICDSGCGFDAATAEKLFHRGFTSKPNGTGIGLVNCREIARAHGGGLTIDSPGVGLGATVKVRLACNMDAELEA